MTTPWTRFSEKTCESILAAFTASFTGSADFSRHSLGQTLTTAPSYSLRQLAGLLLHRVYTLGVPAESFFASAELAKSFRNAVSSVAPDFRVLDGLANFLEQCSDHRYHAQTPSPDALCLTSSSHGPVAFTSHVTFGNRSSVVDQQLGITISTCKDIGVLTIHIPPLPNTTAVYIDVPLKSAELHSIRVSTKKEAQKKYVIEISLKSESQASFYINSSPDRSRRLLIGYTSRKSADDAYSILESMLSESSSQPEIKNSVHAQPLNVSCGGMQYPVSSRGESEMSADLRMHAEAQSGHMSSNVAVGEAQYRPQSHSDEQLAESESTSPARGSTVHVDSDGVLYGDTASEFADQDRHERRGRARSIIYHRNQHSDSPGGSGSDEAQAYGAPSSSPNSVKEQSEIQSSLSQGERVSSLENEISIELDRRSPTSLRKMPPDPATPVYAALKNRSHNYTPAHHAKQQAIRGADDSDGMWDVGLEVDAEPAPNEVGHQHEIGQREKHPLKLSAMTFRASEANEMRAEQARAEKTGKGNAASESIGVKKASTSNANTENANIGKSRTGTTRKGERCLEQIEREVASSPTAEPDEEITLPRKSKRAAATQAQRKIEDQVSSEEAPGDALGASSWEPEAEKKRARKSTPNKKNGGKHNSKVKNHQSRAKEHKAKIVPLTTNPVEHEPGSEPQNNAASDQSPDHKSPVMLHNRDNQLSKSAQNPGGSRRKPERNTNSTSKRKATTVEVLPAKRKKVAIVERPSNIRMRDDQKLQPTTPRTKSQRKVPMIHFTKDGPQNSGLLKPLNRKSNRTVVQSTPRTPRTPLIATAGNLLTPVLPYKGTEKSTTSSAKVPPCEESTPACQPPSVGSQTWIAPNGSPIPAGDPISAGIPDDNIPTGEDQTLVTPTRPGNKTKVFEQAHTKKVVFPLKTRNPFGSAGPARSTTFMDRLQASNDRQRREHDQGQRQDSIEPVATVQVGQQVEPMHKEPALWEEADTTMIEPEPDLHRGEHTLRQRDETSSSSSSSTSEDPASLQQSGGREAQQGKVSLALMEAAKVCLSVSQPIRRLTDLVAN